MRTDERGFAIPLTVLLLTLITVMLAAGFTRVRADRQVAEGTEVSAEALAVARSGLETFMTAQSTVPADGFTDTMYVTGGYAIVTARIMQRPADPDASQMWILRSTGYVVDAATGTTPRAQRTVAQFAQWQTGALNVRGALTAPNGIQYGNRGTVTVSGNDYCGVESAVPGIRTAGTSGSAPSLALSGSPGMLNEGSSQAAAMADETGIDWQAVLDGGIEPDYTTPQYGNFAFPITIYEGSLTAGSALYGSGLLIVTGDLVANSWVYWYGIILVGGKIEFNYSFNYIYGAVVTGLNEQLPTGNPLRTEVGWSGGGSFNSYRAYFYYYSCFVEQALDGLTGFAPIDNAFVDNWATY